MIKPATNFAAQLLPGLSGNSWLEHSSSPQVVRLTPEQPFPFVNRQREYRILKKLSRIPLGVTPVAYRREQLVVEWLDGQPLSTAQFTPENSRLVTLLFRLARQPLLGYRLSLLPLLEQYWQQCQHHNFRWFTRLRRLRLQGEPAPLRLVPLHMDLHPGNVIQTVEGLRLIDWEYAADGDIALEVASLALQNPQYSEAWQRLYSNNLQLDAWQLSYAVKRWIPWLQLLQASWYQLKAEQTQNVALKTLADDYWQQI